MTRFNEPRERVRARVLAKELEEQGYTVVIDPDPSLIPFELKNYRPSLIATSINENLIIEVRARGDSRSVERYQEIADEIRKHKGWRLMLATIDDQYQSDGIEIQQELSEDSILRALSKIDMLLESDGFELAIPYLWSVYISGMRSAGRHQGLAMDATTDLSVLNHMYSMGEISATDYEKSKSFLAIRNKIVHTFNAMLSRSEVQQLAIFTKQKLREWGIIV